jgi:hypothetical protein
VSRGLLPFAVVAHSQQEAGGQEACHNAFRGVSQCLPRRGPKPASLKARGALPASLNLPNGARPSTAALSAPCTGCTGCTRRNACAQSTSSFRVQARPWDTAGTPEARGAGASQALHSSLGGSSSRQKGGESMMHTHQQEGRRNHHSLARGGGSGAKQRVLADACPAFPPPQRRTCWQSAGGCQPAHSASQGCQSSP